MSGWIKLHRKMLNNPVVCKDKDHIVTWVYLLLNATHKEYPVMFNGTKIILQPGQLITGRKSLSKELSIDEHKIDRILKLFENEQQIEQQMSNKNRIVSILSWDEYQGSEQQNEHQMSNNCATTEQQLSTNKNVKNVKNVITEEIKDLKHIVPDGTENVDSPNTINSFRTLVKKYATNDSLEVNEELVEAFEGFREMRVKIKKPLTDRALKMIFKELNKFAANDETKIAVLDQSIMNSYQGVFELKGGSRNGKSGGQSETFTPDATGESEEAKRIRERLSSSGRL